MPVSLADKTSTVLSRLPPVAQIVSTNDPPLTSPLPRCERVNQHSPSFISSSCCVALSSEPIWPHFVQRGFVTSTDSESWFLLCSFLSLSMEADSAAEGSIKRLSSLALLQKSSPFLISRLSNVFVRPNGRRLSPENSASKTSTELFKSAPRQKSSRKKTSFSLMTSSPRDRPFMNAPAPCALRSLVPSPFSRF